MPAMTPTLASRCSISDRLRFFMDDSSITVSLVAGHAQVLVVPNLEAGNMLAKSLTFLAGADAAGIVLGAKVPIILTSRADSVLTRLASCGVAVLVAQARREHAEKVVT